ncbi:MAG: DUF4397 domain-containing protein [Dehalococcoidia bacterium]
MKIPRWKPAAAAFALGAALMFGLNGVGAQPSPTPGGATATPVATPGTTTTPAATPSGQQARVRVAHMVPGAPAIDVYAGNQRILSNIAYRGVSEYVTAPSGGGDLRITPTGDQNTTAATVRAGFDGGKSYTIAAVGRTGAIDTIRMEDDNTAAQSGRAKVRFVHAVQGAPSVNVVAQGGNELFKDVEFREVAGYNDVAAGTYNLEVRNAGNNNLLLTIPSVQLQSGQVVTVFATGQPDANNLAAVPVVYAGPGAQTAVQPSAQPSPQQAAQPTPIVTPAPGQTGAAPPAGAPQLGAKGGGGPDALPGSGVGDAARTAAPAFGWAFAVLAGLGAALIAGGWAIASPALTALGIDTTGAEREAFLRPAPLARRGPPQLPWSQRLRGRRARPGAGRGSCTRRRGRRPRR